MLPIVYINLDKDEQRRRRMQDEFARLGLIAERLHAVWWKNLDAAQQASLYSADLNAGQYYQPLVDGEKGCYASHIHAWRQLLDSDAQALVVFEDDVQLCEGLSAVLDAIAALPAPWDMVKLMGRPQREKTRWAKPLSAGHQLIAYRRVPSFTAGYVISRAGAQKLLQSRLPFGRPIDVDLRFWWENDLTILGVHPPVVRLDSTSAESTIPGRQGSSDWRIRWRKFRMKASLTWGNARHLRRQQAG